MSESTQKYTQRKRYSRDRKRQRREEGGQGVKERAHWRGTESRRGPQSEQVGVEAEHSQAPQIGEEFKID